MRIVVRPVVDPQREIDLTHRFVSVIAEELWSRYGGSQQLNWLEAERHLERIVCEAHAEMAETSVVSLGDAAWTDAPPGSGGIARSADERGSPEVRRGHHNVARLDRYGKRPLQQSGT